MAISSSGLLCRHLQYAGHYVMTRKGFHIIKLQNCTCGVIPILFFTPKKLTVLILIK